MGQDPRDGQAKTAMTPDEIRAARIEAVTDPKLRKELDELVKARDAEVAKVIERQKETFDKRVQDLAARKIRNINGPHLTPPGMQPLPYLGASGQARAVREATAQIQTQDWKYAKEVAPRERNDQIDQKLKAYDKAREQGEPERGEKPRRLVKFEDRFPEEVKKEITRSR